ncbi:hypothetical protein [Halostagnicola kamekurae]|uniref:Uncharacterized protein n=1 Tax=Halostagnicola kamekurae TaxID=619731 RepID=A0A1I6PVL8_9EURY|nr:hypothetical protein SAMN04488556_0804 [Halostagnicola kamekurae]
MSVVKYLSSLAMLVAGVAVMVLLATVVFFVTIFVVSTGSELANYDPSDDFVVLSSTLIVVAVILTGGFTPRLSGGTDDADGDEFDDRTYR